LEKEAGHQQGEQEDRDGLREHDEKDRRRRDEEGEQDDRPATVAEQPVRDRAAAGPRDGADRRKNAASRPPSASETPTTSER
jgi:hypothetical protein